MNEFAKLFETYQVEAFRIELLPFYKVAGEWENFQNFLKTGVVGLDNDFESYVEGVSQKINNGAKHIRARIIEEPITDYQIFETKLGYQPLSKVGAELYFINHSDYINVINRHFGHVLFHDFWLFDDSVVVNMKYNDNNEWLGFEIVRDNEYIKRAITLKNIIISQSYSLDTLIANNKSKF